MKYQVIKVYNNNVVLAKQEDRQVILVSKGIGFGKKPGDTLENDGSIEKVFHELNPIDSKSQLQGMDDVTRQIDYVIKEFLKIAKDKLGYLIENCEATIKEHIEFAIARLKMGLSIENPFLDEIVMLYRAEYKVASIARELIKKRMHIDIGEEEQGFIALHLYAAKTQKSINETIKVTRIYKGCIEIIQDEWEAEIPLRTTASKQFLNNFKIMLHFNKAQKFFSMPISEQVEKMLQKSFNVATKIAKYLQEEKGVLLTKDEIAYLTIDIEKLIQANNEELLAEEKKCLPVSKHESYRIGDKELFDLAYGYIEKLGGKTNIDEVDACTTRLRIKLKDSSLLQAEAMNKLGASGVIRPTEETVQIILGTKAELIAKEIGKQMDLKED